MAISISTNILGEALLIETIHEFAPFYFKAKKINFVDQSISGHDIEQMNRTIFIKDIQSIRLFETGESL